MRRGTLSGYSILSKVIRFQHTSRSMAEGILAERDEVEYSTIVVGRQGLSRSEEFLFGSISSRIVNHARNCTVWVVEGSRRICDIIRP